jgi:broad specificity phosphatase PhoE
VILIRHGQTEFNRVFSATRRDPGIRDPGLTEIGRHQAAAAARILSGHPVRHLIASPYRRSLESAAIIAAELDLPISVDAAVAERFFYACDIGSPLRELHALWPDLVFDHLPDPWWPQEEESEAAIAERCEAFRLRLAAAESWREVAIVTHWGFIRALTGLSVPNGAVLRFDPTCQDIAAEALFPSQPDQDDNTIGSGDL